MDHGTLPSLGHTINRVMALDSTIFLAYLAAPHGPWTALIIVIMAGLSKTLGQSIILFLNRVRPLRFALALGFGVIQYVGGYLLWATMLWLAGTYIFGATTTWTLMAVALGVAYAPQILAFFELTPFFGNGFGFLLTVWTLLAIMIGIQTVLELTMAQAIITSGLGWLLVQIWARTLGRPLYSLGRWLETQLAGTPLEYGWHDLHHVRRPTPWSPIPRSPTPSPRQESHNLRSGSRSQQDSPHE